jgi:outer membrane protein TolC
LSIEIAKQQKKEAFTKYFPSINAIGMGLVANKPMMSMEMDMSAMISPMMQAFTPTMEWLAQQGALDPAVLQGLSQPAEPTKIEAMKNGVVGGVMATQPIFAGGQIVNGNRLAKAGVEVRQLQKQMTDNEVLLETERYFWQIVSLQEKMKTIETSETMLNRILLDVKIAVEAGLTTRNDLLRVELEKNRLESGKLKVENGLMMLKISLGQKIGLSPAGFEIQTPELNEITLLLPVETGRAPSLQHRPEYKLLEKSVEVARLQRDIEIGKNLPTVAIMAGYNYMNFDMDKPNGMKNDFAIASVAVSVPITDWWGGAHAIKRKKLEYQAAENTRQEKADLLLLQMQQILNELNEAYQQVTLSQKSISAAEENLRISSDNFNAGIISLSDLLEAQNLLQQSRDQYTEATTGYYLKLAEYKQVTVGL